MTMSSSVDKSEKKVENKENEKSANKQPIDPNDIGGWGDKIPKS
jgi:hypothetical protein